MSTQNDLNAIESALLRLYRRSPAEIPSEDMDRRILAAARLAASPRSRYSLPLALAASLLMGIALSLQLPHFLSGLGQQHGSVLSLSEPFEVRPETASWPPLEKYTVLNEPSPINSSSMQLAELGVTTSFSTMGVQFPADLNEADVYIEAGFPAGDPGMDAAFGPE